MTVNFTQQFQNQLSTLIDGNKKQKFTLLYKASRDGCSSTSFHNTCDNKGPTVTILYNINNTVYGGYTSVSWHSNSGYTNDPKAFLFRLNYNGTFNPVKLPVKVPQYAIIGNPSYGPLFGNGEDLNTFSGTITNSGHCYQLNGHYKLGNSYDAQGLDYNSFANGHQQVLDIEVYVVEEEPKNLQTPWRRNLKWETEEMDSLKEAVKLYKPLKDLNIAQARILLIGQVGAGKSSFFNTINSIFRGHVTSQANSGSADHSLTTVYRMYQVRNGPAGKPLNFRLCDTRGLEENQGVDVQEIGYILDGHVPDKYQFNPSIPFSPESLGFVASPELGDKIHCVAFVIDGSSVDVMPEKVLERLKSLQQRMNQKSIPQVVLLTKIDRICELVSSDTSAVFSSTAVRDCVEKVSVMMGLPRAHVLPFKNYESEMHLDTNINILSLMSLRQILHFADDYMYNYYDDMEARKMQRLKIQE